MENTTFLLSFFAGVVSFFSPCIIPLIPAYFSFLVGSSIEEIKKGKKNLYSAVVLFCLGFTIIFVILGASATTIGRFLALHLKYFKIFAGIIMIIFALETIGLIHIFSRYKGFSPHYKNTPKGFGAMLFGAGLAIAWTPCVGPVLGAILTMASTQETLAKGVLMLFSYSIGLSIPFFVIAVFLTAHKKFNLVMQKHTKILRIIAGIVLISFALYLFLGR
ncbi:MAG: cytochrome c biogenesis protein CcdA [Candidatus Omnitrophica bacterium]|nr:cytochrome c biogenesis protein CcdA [Candidatus Omnitrophota bacterium]